MTEEALRNAAVAQIVLKRYPDDELHALNLAVGFGDRIAPTMIATDRTIEVGLADRTGKIHDPAALQTALTAEVIRRIEAQENRELADGSKLAQGGDHGRR